MSKDYAVLIGHETEESSERCDYWSRMYSLEDCEGMAKNFMDFSHEGVEATFYIYKMVGMYAPKSKIPIPKETHARIMVSDFISQLEEYIPEELMTVNENLRLKAKLSKAVDALEHIKIEVLNERPDRDYAIDRIAQEALDNLKKD